MNFGAIAANAASQAVDKFGLDTAITVTWKENHPAFEGVDYMEQSEATEAPVNRSATLRGLVHTVSPSTSGFRKFAEVVQGDLIVDFIEAIPFDETRNNEQIVFTVNGKRYIQKRTGRDLAECWDAHVEGATITRTLLLTAAPDEG